MKRILLILLICGILLFSSNIMMLPTGAESINSPLATSSQVAQASSNSSQVIKVGYYPNFTDFVDNINSLNSKGYGVEIFEKIEEVSDLEFEYIELSGDPVDSLLEGEVDLLAFRTKTDKKANQVLYSQMQYSKTYVSLMTKDMDFAYGDFAKMDGKTVATFEDHIGNDRLDFISENLGFSIEYIYGETHNYMDLEADFYLAFSGHRDAEDLNNVLDIGLHNLYLNSTFENQELMDKLDAIFYDIAVTEGSFFHELEEEYLSDNIETNHRGLMPNEIATLQSRPLEVGYIADYAPISYTDDNGKPEGAMVDTLNYYADRYNFEVNYHPYTLDDPLEEYANYDLLLTIYGDGTTDWKHYSTTEPYYLIPLYAQVNLDRLGTIAMDEILTQSPKIGILPYQTVDLAPFVEEHPGTEFVIYDDWYNLLDDFDAGKLDMMMCTESSTAFAELYFDEVNRATIHSGTEIPMQYFVNKNIEDEYLPIFNTMMDRMSESDYAAIFQANANEFLPSQDVSFSEFFKNNWPYFAIFFFVIIAAFTGFYARSQFKKKEELVNSYNTEPLTGFMAPHYFRNNMSEILEKAKPSEYELIALDIDMFKNINTFFSADKGTAIILSMADAIKSAFSGTNTLVCKSFAEQFLIFRKVNEGGTIHHIYEHFIMPAIKSNLPSGYNVYMSFGNIVIDNPTEKINTIIGQAYAAKKAGKSSHKSSFITFDEKMKKQYELMSTITFHMDQALKEKEFYIEYQPKINFNSLQIEGVEALVRWQTNDGTKMSPDDFIPVFEENGFISNLDLYVLGEVCEFIKLNRAKMKIPRISVNLSAHTILADNIVERICKQLSIHKISHNEIGLELTESAVEADTEKFLKVVKELKALGFLISIDDFGAGVSSLNRLSEVEADILKLDKAFFNLKEEGSKSSSIVADVIAMAKHLDMKVVAEGVETYEQAIWLKGIGCDYAQGYYFAKPMSDKVFKKLLVSKKQYEILP